MKFVLDERYRLRGWEKLPFALFDSVTRRTEFYDKNQFMLLMRCDGVQEVDEEALPEAQRKWLARLEREGVISRCGPGAMLLPQQLYKMYPCRYKRDVHWSITGRCNYKCKHCLVSAPHAKFGHPTTAQLLRLVEQMASCGIASVSITGGEPLIREDFWQIVDALVEHGIGIGAVFSNGYLVNDALARLAAWLQGSRVRRRPRVPAAERSRLPRRCCHVPAPGQRPHNSGERTAPGIAGRLEPQNQPHPGAG